MRHGHYLERRRPGWARSSRVAADTEPDLAQTDRGNIPGIVKR